MVPRWPVRVTSMQAPGSRGPDPRSCVTSTRITAGSGCRLASNARGQCGIVGSQWPVIEAGVWFRAG
jgi:hypothetical protein